MIKKLIKQYQDLFLLSLLSRNIEQSETILDVGCGANSYIGLVKKNKKATGIDLFKKSIQASKKKKLHDEYVLGDIRDIGKHFKKKSFDTVVSIDVVEHLSKKDSLKMIKSMEQIARKNVVILTPNGFYPQDPLEGNPYQVHLSAWNPDEFSKMGYTVRGLRGLKYIRGEHATIKYKPWFLWGIIAFVTEPLLYFIPGLSYDIFAVKKMDN